MLHGMAYEGFRPDPGRRIDLSWRCPKGTSFAPDAARTTCALATLYIDSHHNDALCRLLDLLPSAQRRACVLQLGLLEHSLKAGDGWAFRSILSRLELDAEIRLEAGLALAAGVGLFLSSIARPYPYRIDAEQNASEVLFAIERGYLDSDSLPALWSAPARNTDLSAAMCLIDLAFEELCIMRSLGRLLKRFADAGVDLARAHPADQWLLKRRSMNRGDADAVIALDAAGLRFTQTDITPDTPDAVGAAITRIVGRDALKKTLDRVRTIQPLR
jgi:hypothetical protein